MNQQQNLKPIIFPGINQEGNQQLGRQANFGVNPQAFGQQGNPGGNQAFGQQANFGVNPPFGQQGNPGGNQPFGQQGNPGGNLAFGQQGNPGGNLAFGQLGRQANPGNIQGGNPGGFQGVNPGLQGGNPGTAGFQGGNQGQIGIQGGFQKLNKEEYKVIQVQTEKDKIDLVQNFNHYIKEGNAQFAIECLKQIIDNDIRVKLLDK